MNDEPVFLVLYNIPRYDKHKGVKLGYFYLPISLQSTHILFTDSRIHLIERHAFQVSRQCHQQALLLNKVQGIRFSCIAYLQELYFGSDLKPCQAVLIKPLGCGLVEKVTNNTKCIVDALGLDAICLPL